MEVFIQWASYPNQNIRSMSCDVFLWDSIHAEVWGRKLTDEQNRLDEAMQWIRGIESIRFEKYRITVTKGDCFPWGEIVSRVESVFAEWCACELKQFVPEVACQSQRGFHV